MFGKLMEALVGSMLMYGAEVGQCRRQLDCVDQMQLQAIGSFWGLGRLHLKASYYNKRNTHFDVQELLLQFWTERHKTWQEYGEA